MPENEHTIARWPLPPENARSWTLPAIREEWQKRSCTLFIQRVRDGLVIDRDGDGWVLAVASAEDANFRSLVPSIPFVITRLDFDPGKQVVYYAVGSEVPL